MNKALEIDKAEKELKEVNDRLHIFNTHIAKLNSEIFILRTVERNILENIRTLKTEALIISASEYAKARRDLGTAQSRLSFLNIDLANHLRALEKIEERVIQCKEAYAKALLIPLAKVIIGKFGSRNGQE
jgi:chromosome segregation ATPase